MLNEKEAIRLGLNACVDKMGRDFVLSHKDEAVMSYGKVDDDILCFLGVGNAKPNQYDGKNLVLDSTSKFQYYVNCKVNLLDGTKIFTNCELPIQQEKFQ